MAKKYYNTTNERLKAIKEMIQSSGVYEQFKIKFESPEGDVLYVKRVGCNKYERFMSISNLFGSDQPYKYFKY